MADRPRVRFDRMARLPVSVVLLIVPLASVAAIAAEPGHFIDLDAIRAKQAELGGCAAVTCYVLLQTKRPAEDVSLNAVLARLPATRDCSVAEIVSFLEDHEFSAVPARQSPLDVVPPPGAWNIVLDETKERRHWFGIYSMADGSMAIYGARGPDDLHIVDASEIAGELREVQEKLRAITGAQDPVLVTVQVREEPNGLPASWQVAGVALLAAGSLGLGTRWLYLTRRVRSVHTATGLPALVVAAAILAGAAPGVHATPKLNVENPDTDLGVLVLDPYTTKHTREIVYRLVNQGTSPLTIEDIKFSCSCTSHELDRKQIPPGESAELVLTVAIEQGSSNTATAMIKTNETENAYHRVAIAYQAEMLWKVEPKNIGWLVDLESPAAEPKKISLTMVRPGDTPIPLSRIVYDDSLFSVQKLEAGTADLAALDRKRNEGGTLQYDTYTFTVQPTQLHALRQSQSGDVNFEFASGVNIAVPLSIAVGRPVETSPQRLVYSQGREDLRVFVRVRDSALDPNGALDVAEFACESFDLDCRTVQKTKNSLVIAMRVLGRKQPKEECSVDFRLTGVLDAYSKIIIPIRYIDMGPSEQR